MFACVELTQEKYIVFQEQFSSGKLHKEAVNYANWYSVEFDGDLILEGSRDRTDVVTDAVSEALG